MIAVEDGPAWLSESRAIRFWTWHIELYLYSYSSLVNSQGLDSVSPTHSYLALKGPEPSQEVLFAYSSVPTT